MKMSLATIALLFPAFAFAATPTTSQDIGAVGAVGSTSTANGVYTINASGADISGISDEFRFVYGSLTGDGEITARVDSLTATNAWTKAGVMIRETLSPGSRNAFARITVGKGVSLQGRTESGASTTASAADPAPRAPYWLRLRRVGNNFSAYVSADGVAWRQQGSPITIAMRSAVYVGLAVSSHSDGVLATAKFSRVNYGPVGSGPVPTNSPPSISGTPATTAVVGTQYVFTPAATDANGDTLLYSIANRPAWATFNTTTGRLAGTPTATGAHQNILVAVSDGQASAQLPAFAIVVSGTAPTNRAPVISGAPLTSAPPGSLYSFQPTASDADGDTLTFSITNRPAWATFSTQTGRLQGTPAASNAGITGNIQIRVGDGKTTAPLPTFAITVPSVSAGSATLSWTPPTRNSDGSPLTNLAGYRVYWGPAAGTYNRSATLNNAGLSSYVVESLAPGTHYFMVTATNSAGRESAPSNVGSKTIR
jgi:hypothetical protein